MLSSNYLKSSPVLGSYSATNQPAPVLFRGIGHAVDNNNILAIKALRGNPSTYSANPTKPIDDYPENAGADTLLVTALQARNNARIVIAGSIDMFSNKFFRTKWSGASSSGSPFVGNELFCGSLSKWVFGEVGVLRFRDIVHNKVMMPHFRSNNHYIDIVACIGDEPSSTYIFPNLLSKPAMFCFLTA